MSEPDHGYAAGLAWDTVAPGFTTLDDAVEGLREWADDDPEAGVDADGAEALVRAAWRRRQEYLASEPARRPTDDQRVADAFAALEADGLVARMHCGFDQGEGSAECQGIARAEGRPGYVFFHAQDAERLAYPEATLFLGFDAVPPPGVEKFAAAAEYDDAAVAIGHRIAQTMVAVGLDVRWNASPTARIEIVGLDWRRPLPA